ncbi:MAG: histidine kinase dimerization/phosphoacceptor domain -containing protein [Methanoregula sp.]|nr:histidine kinase dimerization/phosphoacceptor domain -containing protein [Methanoregula sp.]
MSVIYVDDGPDLLDIGKLLLERSGFFSVTTAQCAPDAIRSLEQGRFDAIISDYQMPGMNGIQFLTHVRSRFGSIPFILFTGRGCEEVVIEAINNGADFYLQKGGNPLPMFAELAQKIKIAVEKQKTIVSIHKQTIVLEERVKELNCLYRFAEAINKPGVPLDAMLQDCVDLLPSGYNHPEYTNVRVVYLEKEYTTTGFKKSVWNQNAPIILNGECVGTVEVSYTGEWADRTKEPFLAEENSFLNGIVQLLKNCIALKIASGPLKKIGRNQEIVISGGISGLPDPGQLLTSERTLRLAAEKDLHELQEQKEILLSEIQNRVKNNLRAVHRLLDLQSKYIRDEKVLKALHESQNRIRAMALVHEILYQSPEITNIDLDTYVNTLAKNLFEFYGIKEQRISLQTDIPEIFLNVNSAIPVGLIVNELMSNSLKHAFPSKNNGEIFIKVRKKNHTLSMLFRDTGIGIPKDLNWRDTKSLGLRMVFSLVEQMKGNIGLDRSRGTEFSMVLEEKKP